MTAISNKEIEEEIIIEGEVETETETETETEVEVNVDDDKELVIEGEVEEEELSIPNMYESNKSEEDIEQINENIQCALDEAKDQAKINISNLTKSEEDILEKAVKVDTNENQSAKAISLLQRFKAFITGKTFDKQCQASADKYGVPKEIVKNKFIKNFLKTVANILDLTFTIVGDVVINAVNFVSFVIGNIVNFAVDSVLKLIKVMTLNCGGI